MRIEEAIQQPKFRSSIERAHVNILFTAAYFNQQNNLLLKSYGISVQQFNILRILRGRKGKPATIKLLTERMLDKMSNASRLVDKLVSKELVLRVQSKDDRRRVDITITQIGLELVDKASTAIDNYMELKNDLITPSEADLLSSLLDKLRG